MPKRRRSKFGVYLDKKGKKDRTYNGVVYDSIKEMEHAISLDYQIQAGFVASWKRQQIFKLSINGLPVMMTARQAVRKVDFTVTYADGHIEMHEVKGRVTPDFLLRQSIFALTYLRDHPEITYRTFT